MFQAHGSGTKPSQGSGTTDRRIPPSGKERVALASVRHGPASSDLVFNTQDLFIARCTSAPFILSVGDAKRSLAERRDSTLVETAPTAPPFPRGVNTTSDRRPPHPPLTPTGRMSASAHDSTKNQSQGRMGAGRASETRQHSLSIGRWDAHPSAPSALPSPGPSLPASLTRNRSPNLPRDPARVKRETS